MATYLSPGVYPREIDLSAVTGGAGPLRAAFVGTAKKGPMNTPTFVSTAQSAIDTFGEPFVESYLMYAVLAYLENSNQAYVIRVGIECQDGQDEALSEVCIDTSGNRLNGWNRIPVFTGIDYGKITMRAVTASSPVTFHDAGIENITFTDVSVSVTDGPTDATLQFSGETDLSDNYIGCSDENFTVFITGQSNDGYALEGATFKIFRASDSAIMASGTLSEKIPGTSENIEIGDGLTCNIVVTDGRLDVNDMFSFIAKPYNREFIVEVEGVGTTHTMSAASYTSAEDLVNAINALIAADDYIAVATTVDDGTDTVYPQLRTKDAGDRIQLTGSCAFASEVGVQQYVYDIPRSYLYGSDAGPYFINTSSNRISLDVIPADRSDTINIVFTLPTGTNLSATTIAAAIDGNGTYSGETYFTSFALTAPGGIDHVVIVTADTHRLDQLYMKATYSNLKTLMFAEEIGILSPYTKAYRGFYDTRISLPDTGEVTPSVPLSCETDPDGSQCALDSAYFSSIVGWFVATSAGTWLDDYTLTLSLQTTIAGNSAARYQLVITDSDGATADSIQNISFDKNDARYIANVLNPGTSIGGANGNDFVNWEDRPSFLNNDVDETTGSNAYEARQPAQLSKHSFSGGANGIPTDPAYSSELDAAIIGNSASSSGMYGIQNSETYDISLLVIPGMTSGAVIGQGLQLCESRGDVLYIVDPPFGLRPQQVVDWHNGMLLSDLSSAINSSYGALYWGWLEIYDQYSAQNIWVPPSGQVAGVFANTANVAEQWMAPAGLNRGVLTTPLAVEYNPSQGERDLLYGSGNAVNPLVSFPNDGIVVFGQRTLQRADTALDRVNVRMLLINLKKNLIETLRSFIFEPNDSTTWAQVKTLINPYLADVQARRGLDAFNVVCDATNNTAARRDLNQLWVSVFIKPTRAIEFIVLNLVVMQSSASFSSEEVLAAGGVVTA
ncbi:MAG: phage tail sheath subtilisin-like domain-containing protein [Candidatus Cloacimonetes bacterium]|jgi:hypothetical protein|nr:phage tail sheath subtilisin-like domain-containing protein [Candidatus Cloacimonadota bacterium]